VITTFNADEIDALIKCPWRSWYKFLDYAKQKGFHDSKELRQFWHNQIVHQVEPDKPTFFPIYSKVTGGWQMDIWDQVGNYFLMILNINTKKLYGYHMTSKNTEAVVKALKEWFKLGLDVKTITSDQEPAFLTEEVTRIMQEHSVQHFTTTDNDHHILGPINRLMRTLRDEHKHIFNEGKEVTQQQMKRLIDEYNKSVHATTGLHPDNMSVKQELEFIQKMNAKTAKIVEKVFEKGDYVRIRLHPSVFDKVRTRISDEAYTIDGKEGRSYWIRALDGSVDKVPANDIVKAQSSVPPAQTIKNNKREEVAKIISYDTAGDKYLVEFDTGGRQEVTARKLREGNPTTLSLMEKKYWTSTGLSPSQLPAKILAMVPKVLTTGLGKSQVRASSQRKSKGR
jgi:ribosomal protein L21E